MAVAQDHNTVTGPGVGRSEITYLQVVSSEEVRRRLERQLTEARDRIVQSRDALAQKGSQQLRTARAQAGRAEQQLQDLTQRWQANNLDADVLATLAQARQQLAKQAIPPIAALLQSPARAAGSDNNTSADNTNDASDIADTNDPQDRAAADAALAEAERMLTDILNQHDLGRVLARLIERQQQLNQLTTEFIRDLLTGDAAQRDDRQQQILAQQQQDLSQQLNQWLANLRRATGRELRPAQSLAQSLIPDQHLRDAANALAGSAPLTAAASQQRQAVVEMQQLLDAIRGTANRQDVIDQLAQLGARQRAVQSGARDGDDLQPLGAEQRSVQRDTQQLQREQSGSETAESRNQALQEALADALKAQQDASDAASQGNRQQAAAAAAAAAAALAQAERAARQAEQQNQEQQNQNDQQQAENESDSQPDALSILRELAQHQETVTLNIRRLDRRLREQQQTPAGDDPQLGLAARRDLPGISTAQQEIHLRIDQEVLPLVEPTPIAQRAIQRVSQATGDATDHLLRPAVGRRGVQYGDRALLELQRLLQIVDESQQFARQQEQADQNAQQGAGQAGGQNSAPPFPGLAQIALLIAEQQAIAQATSLRIPGQWEQQQEAVSAMTTQVAAAMRPGTVPAQWAARAERAMASAHDLLGNDAAVGGVALRSEQDLAVYALEQMLATSKMQQNSSSSSSSSGQSNQQDQQQQADQAQGGQQQRQADQGGASEPSGGEQQAQNGQPSEQGQNQNSSGEGEDPASQQSGQPLEQAALTDDTAPGDDAQQSLSAEDLVRGSAWMQLPPRMRERLREFDQDDLPAEARPLYRQYLELLEQAE